MKKGLLMIPIFTIFSCKVERNKSGSDILNDNIKIIDECEYIQFENGVSGSNNYNYTITHKGNCKNPIHYK